MEKEKDQGEELVEIDEKEIQWKKMHKRSQN